MDNRTPLENRMKPGIFGVNLADNNSPLYIVQRVSGLALLCSVRFDDPPCCWVTIEKEDFWPLT
jgi:hypothetical protein